MDVFARNEFISNNNHIINAVIRRNMPLLRALRLEIEDVYQELAIAMLKAVEGFNAERSPSLEAHVRVKLQYAVLDLKEHYKPCGITGLRGNRVTLTSVENYYDDGNPYEIEFEDSGFGEVDISDIFEILTTGEKETLRQSMDGFYHRKKNQRETLRAAQNKIRDFYMREESYASFC